MFKTLLTTVAAVALMSTSAQAADCKISMDKVYGDGTMYQDSSRYSVQNRQVIQNLRDAAQGLRAQGREEACAEVVEVMHEVSETYRADMKKMDGDRKFGMEWKDIEPRLITWDAADAEFESEDLIGTNVYNYKNEFLGEVDGLLMRGGKGTHMIVGHGGFWNIGDDEAAIPLKNMRWDPESEAFYINLTEEQLDNAPDYDQENGRWVIDKNDGYFDSIWK